MFLTGLLPIFLILAIALIFSILYLTGIKWFRDLRRNIAISVICILYLLHPTLTKASMALFQCTQVDSDMKRVSVEMTIE